jgi:DNA repair protein RadA/Sms
MSIFVCESCGTKHKKWIGKCEACGEWNTIVEEGKFTISGNSKNADDYRKIDLPNVNFINLPDQEHESFERITSGIDEFDRVLGGGFVPASAILIGGDPGIGKSTLLLQTCAKAAQNNVKVMYVSGEESVAQIAMRAKRLGFEKSNILLASANSIMSVLKEIEHNLPQMLIIDSIQTMFMANIEASPGSVSQIRATAMEIIAFCKAKGIIVIMVGHITKDGQIAGPKLLEHMVDVVIYFEGENTHNFRILRAVKNRFGSVNEIGLFAMQGEGLEEIKNPSSFFLTEAHNKGKATVFVAMEGTRPVITEVEALVAQSYLPSPRRNVVGWDSNRLAMIVAILQTHCKLQLYDKDIYLGIAGGFKTMESANDLAVAIALIRALKGLQKAGDIVAIGELGLSGQVRNVSWFELRIQEAIKLGYTKFIVPHNDKVKKIIDKKHNIDIVYVKSVQDILPLLQ